MILKMWSKDPRIWIFWGGRDCTPNKRNQSREGGRNLHTNFASFPGFSLKRHRIIATSQLRPLLGGDI
jgi:hypothetical protein